MTVAFFSNYLTHHQLPFCLEMQSRIGGDFAFVATEEIEQERISLGYEDMNHKYSFVANAHDSEIMKSEALRLARECDVVIFGSAPEFYLQERMKLNKLTFRYCERPLKKGRHRIFNPRVLNTMLHMHTAYSLKKLYLLCASAYTYGDCALVGGYPRKAFKWGYFPENEVHGDIDNLISNKAPASILWAGRLIEWKHPDLAIEVAKRLKSNGIKFELNILGNGILKEKLEKEIYDVGLDDCVNILGAVPSNMVRDYMNKSEIFLFTSDRNEGWGAVLNEAMNSACAVVANKSIGSVPFLIKDKENGLLYEDGNADSLVQKVNYCLAHREECHRLGRMAYQSIDGVWNAKVATERFLALSEALLAGEKVGFDQGPCSKATLL